MSRVVVVSTLIIVSFQISFGLILYITHTHTADLRILHTRAHTHTHAMQTFITLMAIIYAMD